MNDQSNYIRVRGGLLGRACPLIVFFIAIIALSICGIRGSKCYWSAGVLAVAISFFTFEDKDAFQDAVVEGIKDDVFVLTLMALFFAGILSKILTAGHLVDGMMWVASNISFPPVMMPFLTFVCTAVIATASGTSSGSVATVTPVFLPLAVSMGCQPAVICGAIISGAYFGDNLAPISDTTIASALTQEVPMIRVVHSRLKYSLTGGAFSGIMLIIVGMKTTKGVAGSGMQGDATYAKNIVFLILPILVVTLMIKGFNLLTSLLIADILGAIMLVVMRMVTLNELFNLEGPIVSGIDNMTGPTILVMFAFIASSIARKSGFMDQILETVRRHAKTPRSSEAVIGIFTMLFTMATGSNTAAVAVTGPVARQIMKPYQINRARTANVLDGMSAGSACFVPHSPANALIATLAIEAGVGVSANFSAFDYAIYNFHGMALLFLFWFAIITGLWRTHEPLDDIEAKKAK